MSENQPRPPTPRKPATGRIYLLVGLVALAVVAAMFHSLRTGARMAAKHALLIDAAMEIKYETALAHLWLEEILTGDSHEKIEDVWAHLTSAQSFARAMLEGGKTGEGRIIALSDPHLRANVKQTIAILADFRAVAEQRYAAGKDAGIGSEIDQRFDDIFHDLLKRADLVEGEIQALMAHDLDQFRVLQWLLIGATAVLAIIAGALLGAYDRRRARDLQEIRQLNEELEHRVRQRTAQLEAANKELEAFSYSVSHDLRAPLRSMDGFSTALLEDYLDALDTQGQDYLRRVCAAAQRMGRLIDDILLLSRATRGEMRQERVDLGELAEEVIAELRQAEPAREVECAIAPELVAEGDGRLLRTVLQNLLGNAWKFTAASAPARIEVGVLPAADGEDADQPATPVFFVRDNGAGFDMDYANKLFGAFQRLHREEEFEGTGIGLATVERIVQRHGGRVWGEGKVGAGATFYFTLGDV